MRAKDFLTEFVDDRGGDGGGEGPKFITWKQAVKKLTANIRPTYGRAKLMDPETLSMVWDAEAVDLVFGAGAAGEYAYIGVYASPGISPMTQRPMITAMMIGLPADGPPETLGRYFEPMTEQGCSDLIKRSIQSLRK